MSFDPVRLHAVLDVLGYEVRYTGAGFDSSTPWKSRIVLRAVDAYGVMDSTHINIPGRAPVPKSGKQRTIERAEFEAYARVLVDDPDHSLGSTIEQIVEQIEAALKLVERGQ